MQTSLNSVAPSLAPVRNPFEAIKLRYDTYRVYRTTVKELSSLSDRGLADLGLSRSMIRSVARAAAYGG